METPTYRIHQIQTGAVRVHPQQVEGSKINRSFWILTSQKWTEWLPINTYLIEHSNGLVLFDTGEHPSVNEPDFYPWWAPQYRKMCQFDIHESESVVEGIRRLGYSPHDVRYVILSHLHSDHVGGISRLSKSEFVISEREWADGHRLGATFMHGYQKHRFHIPDYKYRIIHHVRMNQAGEFEKGYDLFGDGSLVIVPTPGHTFGHQSLLVNGKLPVCLAGDAIYTQTQFEREIPDGVADDKKAAVTTMARLREWSERNDDAPILSTHDPEAGVLLSKRNGMI
ncbi:N-acyl homoserine lactonase family protein [Mycolicibacterium fortuitum]|nr:N-acyl homoserine lactonase family protein [Mycolicibacterium fortuitum]